MAWDLMGNAGTNPSGNFLGTSDNEPLVVKTNGQPAMQINVAAASTARVEIVGNWNGQEGALRLTGDKPTIKFAGGPAAGNQSWLLHLGSDGAGSLEFFKQGANPGSWDNVMTMAPSGSVGIGTADPAGKVEIVGNWNGEDGALRLTGDKPTLKFAGGSVAGNQSWILHLGSDGGGDLEFFTQAAGSSSWKNVMTLSPSGNVGIGTTNPSSKLEVTGDPTPGSRGVVGNNTSPTGIGVLGQNDGGDAVFGNSRLGRGVVGTSQNATGVEGFSVNRVGVFGSSTNGDAIFGNATTGRGVVGHSGSQAGVVGDSDTFDGVYGVSRNPKAAGVSGHNPGGLAGLFEGNMILTGTLTAFDVVLSNSDCAEDFDITGSLDIEPGTVMVIDRDGGLQAGHEAYDKKVAGVISGAGDFKPGIVLGKQPSKANRVPIALVGKVYCKVDASYSAIEIGDLLTTSPTPGHAMKVTDPLRALGSVIGKALREIDAGQGLIPILIALQ